MAHSKFAKKIEHALKSSKGPMDLRESFACVGSCSLCCFFNEPPQCSKEEFDRIRKFLKAKGIDEDEYLIKNSNGVFVKLKDSPTPKKIELNYEMPHLEEPVKACVFLADDLSCNIYDARPDRCVDFNCLDSGVVGFLVRSGVITADEFECMPTDEQIELIRTFFDMAGIPRKV